MSRWGTRRFSGKGAIVSFQSVSSRTPLFFSFCFWRRNAQVPVVDLFNVLLVREGGTEKRTNVDLNVGIEIASGWCC